LKTNGTILRKIDESCYHKDFRRHNLEKQMRTVAIKVTYDTTSKKTDENCYHRDFRWHNLQSVQMRRVRDKSKLEVRRETMRLSSTMVVLRWLCRVGASHISRCTILSLHEDNDFELCHKVCSDDLVTVQNRTLRGGKESWLWSHALEVVQIGSNRATKEIWTEAVQI
jgi:hypothetical protein